MPALTAHHVGITVADLDQAVEFYRDVLDLTLVDRFSVSGEAFSDAVDVHDATGRFAHLDGGDIRVELIEYAPRGADRTGGNVNDPGSKHLGFRIDDVDGFFEALPDDVETLSEPRTTETGSRILFLRDPDGNLVELLET